MNPLYIFLAVLAGVLFIMGFLVSLFQKRMLKLNLDNTFSFTKKLNISDDKDFDIDNEPVILKNSDNDEILDFIDDEIL